jgi:acyl dehydratase
MATRTLTRPPSILPLYARAAAPLIPGASLLPFVPGRGDEVPDVELTLPDVEAGSDAVAAYARVCAFPLRSHLPATYPHVLAFPLHMAVMADGRFPFGAVGLVHVENRIVQHRPIAVGERVTLRVRPTKLEPHPKGRTFAIVTEARVGAEKVWEGHSTMLRRGGGSGDAGDGGAERQPADAAKADEAQDGPPATGEWRLGGDLGRRYAAVSGDRNPIHMHSLTARALGFPRAIAHGMWTKARCLAALEGRLPEAFAVDVRFRRPILLPARVAFGSADDDGAIRFAVRDAERGTAHLDGRVEPLADANAHDTGGDDRP